MLTTWAKALRLKHWIKNFFVLAPYLIGPHFGNTYYLVRIAVGVLLFGMVSSAVYLINDIVDLESDRLHPEKRLRPIASGAITLFAAKGVAATFLILSFTAAFLIDHYLPICLAVYLLNNIIYSYYLKQKTVLDAMSIAFGFVLRVIAGGVLVDIVISNWMIICVFCLSLFLAFGKRRAEIENLNEQALRVRKVHESYTAAKLDILLSISASVTIMAYILYCIDPQTADIHQTEDLLFTTPFVIYCIYRYTLKVQESKEREGPVELLSADRGFLIAGSLWVLSFLLLIWL